jgi:hypothetical protein
MEDEYYVGRLVFTDKATFHVNGKVNRHNLQIWGTGNPNSSIEQCLLHHIINEHLWPIYLHGGHRNQDGLSWHGAAVANPVARWWFQWLLVPTWWGTTPLSQCSLVLPEWTSASPLDWPCYYQWPGISQLATQVTWPYPLCNFFCGSMWRTLCVCHPCHKICQSYDSVLLLPSKLSPGHMPRDTRFPHWIFVNLCDVSKTVHWCLTRSSNINGYFILNT